MSKKNKVEFELFDESEEYEDTQKGKYLTFKLAKESYGIEIKTYCNVTIINNFQQQKGTFSHRQPGRKSTLVRGVRVEKRSRAISAKGIYKPTPYR